MCKIARLIFRIIIVTHDSQHSLIIIPRLLCNRDYYYDRIDVFDK